MQNERAAWEDEFSRQVLQEICQVNNFNLVIRIYIFRVCIFSLSLKTVSIWSMLMRVSKFLLDRIVLMG